MASRTSNAFASPRSEASTAALIAASASRADRTSGSISGVFIATAMRLWFAVSSPAGHRWTSRPATPAILITGCCTTFALAGLPVTGRCRRVPAEEAGIVTMELDAFERLERLIFRPVSTRPDWLKAWRHEAQHLLFLARRAEDDDDLDLLQELEDQARDMADMVEGRLGAEGL